MVVIGDGVVGLMAPRRHSLLWRFSEAGYERAMEFFAERPTPIRFLAAAQIGGARVGLAAVST